MIENHKKFQFLTVVLLLLILPISVIPLRAEVIPVIPLASGENSFEPTTIGNYSYYIVEPGYDGTGIRYSGADADIRFTTNTNTGIVINEGSDTVANGDTMPIASITPELRTISNPFFDDESVPRLLNISQTGEITDTPKLLYENAIPISLHMGRSFTFFFNQSLEYYAILNTTEPFFLDVDVTNPNAQINFDLSSTIYPGIDPFMVSDKISIPIIPDNLELQTFRIDEDNNRNSIITITPLPFSFDLFGSSTIEQGQFYTGSFEQGECYDIETDPRYDNDLKLLDMKFFQFPVETGNTYQIYYYENEIYDNFDNLFSRCSAGNLDVVNTDFPSSFNYIDGSLTNDVTGLVLNVMEDGFINVSLIATGLVFKDYSFFFTMTNQIPLPKNVPLTFNDIVMLSESPNTYYTFTLNQPSMLAINFTDSGSLAFDFDWSVYDSEINDYLLVSPSNFNAEEDNLLNDSLGDIVTKPSSNYNWVYLPEGKYRLDVSGTNLEDGEFQFNLVPVQTFTTRLDLDINEDSIYAIELPLSKPDFNFINVSTTSQNNLSVLYEYAIIGKYSFLSVSDTVTNTWSSFSLGNQQNNGNWTAYDFNDTNIRIYSKPTQTKFVPIMLVRPYSAVGWDNNNTESNIYSYTTILTISSNVNDDYHPNTNLNGIFVGDGYHITVPGAISNEKSVAINNETVTDNDQVLALTLTTSPGQLYNLTLYLEGSHSNGSGSLNATFQNVWVHSGNFLDTQVFDELYYRETNTSAIHSQMFLSMATESYLFVDIIRNGTLPYFNATLRVVLTPINVEKLNIVTVTENFSWNGTASSLELIDTEPLWEITNYAYPVTGVADDFLIPLVVLAGVGGAGIVGVLVLNKRKGT